MEPDWKNSLMSDSRLKRIVSPSYDQREFECEICKQGSIGDLKIIKDKLQDSLDVLNSQLSLMIHKHLPLFLHAIKDVLSRFEGIASESEHYKLLAQLNES